MRMVNELVIPVLGNASNNVAFLHDLGHFHECDEDGFAIGEVCRDGVCTLGLSDRRVRAAVASYQAMRPWLKKDGDFGEVTVQSAVSEAGRRCGCPDHMRRPGRDLPRWGDPCFKGITTAFDYAGMKRDLGAKTPAEVWAEGNEIINAACGAVLSMVGKSEDPMIRAIMGRMGSGTLAWSYLVGSGCADRILQEYNRAKTWGYHDLLWVLIHELLHALGIGHTSVKGQVMNPYYSPSLSAFGAWDLDQLVKRYGKPADAPAPPPLPPPPPGVDPRGDYGILTWFNKDRTPTGFTEEVFHRATVPVEGE